jgi:hypothetical protein
VLPIAAFGLRGGYPRSACKPCDAQRLATLPARPRAGEPPPAPLAKALARVGADLPPLPASYDFRRVLLTEIESQWATLAKDVVRQARTQPAILRQVLQLVLEGEDDDSALQFWQLVMASAAQRHRPDGEGLDAAPDSLAADEDSGHSG